MNTGPTPRAPTFSLSAFLTFFPPSKGIQRKMMEQEKPLSAGPWALPPGGWLPGHVTSPEGQGRENTNLGLGKQA